MHFYLELFELSKIDVMRLIHLFSCMVGGVLLLLTYWAHKEQSDTINWGIPLISFACFLWCGMDLYRILGFMKIGEVNIILKTFSIYNNAFFLASFPYFPKAFLRLKKKFAFFRDAGTWVNLVLVANVGIMFFYFLLWDENKPERNAIIKNLDVLYSILTFMGVGYAIAVSFFRGIVFNRWLGVLGILLTLLMVVPQFFFVSFFNIKYFDIISVALLSSQIFMLFMLLILTQGWVLEGKMVKLDEKIVTLERKVQEEQLFSQELQVELESSVTDNLVLKEHLGLLSVQTTERENERLLSEGLEKLSNREIEILQHIDKSYTDIGLALFISRETVITHKKNIESKLGISGKEQLIQYALSHQLLVRE